MSPSTTFLLVNPSNLILRPSASLHQYSQSFHLLFCLRIYIVPPCPSRSILHSISFFLETAGNLVITLAIVPVFKAINIDGTMGRLETILDRTRPQKERQRNGQTDD